MTKYYTLTGIQRDGDGEREEIYSCFILENVRYEKESEALTYKSMKIEVSDAELTQEHMMDVYPEMMNGSFVITQDHLDDELEHHCGPASIATIKATGQAFRLLDDDGVLYYSGVCIHDGGEESIFSPLDVFGLYSGCTDIQYLTNGKWVSI
tara:strand:- start:335 stop:790 length:456 start_codon:yes stop_codon:yes gene_type:complete